MKRLIVIELKLEEFKPEHKGQVELYLRWLNKYERMEGEESPLALIVCAEKSSETIELLELDNSGIHVAQYLTQMPSKEVLEESFIKQLKERNYSLNKEDRIMKIKYKSKIVNIKVEEDF